MPKWSANELAALRRLAKAAGIHTQYKDGLGRERRPPPETLMAILRALGHPLRSARDAPRLLERARRTPAAELLPPVVVAWDGDAAPIRVPMPSRASRIAWTLELEDRGGEYRSEQAVRRGSSALSLRLPRAIPMGRHRLIVEAGSARAVATVLSAPARCYQGEQQDAEQDRELGIFLPLYAVRSRRGWGIGDLSDLEALTQWAGSLGCNLVGTLPLLASFLDEPFEPSPYAPVSRLHFSELFADLTAAPELKGSPAAQRLLASATFARKLDSLRKGDMVDYRAVWRLKRQVLSFLAAAAFRNPARLSAMEKLLEQEPTVREYARFRAAAERKGTTWQHWNARAREGQLSAADFESSVYQRHLYAQLLIREQLTEQSRLARERGGRLYLDLPLGAHGGGFDLWRFREHFATDLATGAPPDTMFTHGQNWGFPPLHPEQSRLLGHAYLAAAIRNHLRFAGALRIDHIAGLHRLFCIPAGMNGEDGTYVTYPHDEFYAVLSMESHLARARIIGENLGTVPPEVTQTMTRRGVLGMWVGQFGLVADSARAVPPIPSSDLACLNTHDIPPFAAHWRGEDITLRHDFGWLDDEAAAGEARGREQWRTAIVKYLRKERLLKAGKQEPPAEQVARAILLALARSDAGIVLVNLEDLWGEALSQNVPGTTDEHENWKRKASRMLESIISDGELAVFFRSLARARRGHAHKPARARQQDERTFAATSNRVRS
jgi:4-alpha-glucanotransferase